MDSNLLTIEIITTNEPLVKLLARSLTSINDKGKFDILPSHANFISLIKSFVQIKGENLEKTVKFNKGILYCKKDKVKVFVES